MSACTSPYLEQESLATSLANVTGAFDSHVMYGTPGSMPDISTYEIEFSAFSWTACTTPSIGTGTHLYTPDLSHLTPISEPADIHDSITPLSLHPPFDFSSVSHTPTLSSLNTSIDVPPSRPRSSPSSFGPCPAPWSPEPQVKQETGLGIHGPCHQLTPVSSPRPRNQNSLSSVPESLAAPSPQRHWTPIAPNPVGLRQLQANAKRSLSSDDLENSPASKRKRSAPSSPHIGAEMTAEDVLLLKLKDEENLTWKEIASRFDADLGRTMAIPALQMRLKRLRERMRVWTEMDVQALRMAQEYWVNQRFEIIASKMAEFGATEKWTTKQCQRKWQEIGFATEHLHAANRLMRTPTFSPQLYQSSPVEGPGPGYYQFPVSST